MGRCSVFWPEEMPDKRRISTRAQPNVTGPSPPCCGGAMASPPAMDEPTASARKCHPPPLRAPPSSHPTLRRPPRPTQPPPLPLAPPCQVYAPNTKFDGADFTNGVVDRAYFNGASFKARGFKPDPLGAALPFGLGSEAPKPAPSAAPPFDLVSVGRGFKRYEPPTLPTPHRWLCLP